MYLSFFISVKIKPKLNNLMIESKQVSTYKLRKSLDQDEKKKKISPNSR